jgi:hypothetical protein
MKVLFDHGTPVPLRHALTGHSVSTAYEMGWAKLDNGALLEAAEREFDILVTTDQNLRYQQTFSGRRLAILVLPTTSWPRMQTNLDRIRNILNAMRPGELAECHFDR